MSDSEKNTFSKCTLHLCNKYIFMSLLFKIAEDNICSANLYNEVSL